MLTFVDVAIFVVVDNDGCGSDKVCANLFSSGYLMLI